MRRCAVVGLEIGWCRGEALNQLLQLQPFSSGIQYLFLGNPSFKALRTQRLLALLLLDRNWEHYRGAKALSRLLQ